MVCHFGERRKKESHVRQSSSGYDPRRPLRLGKKGVAHGQDWILVRHWRSTGLGEEVGTIQTRGSFAMKSIQNVPPYSV